MSSMLLDMVNAIEEERVAPRLEISVVVDHVSLSFHALLRLCLPFTIDYLYNAVERTQMIGAIYPTSQQMQAELTRAQKRGM